MEGKGEEGVTWSTWVGWGRVGWGGGLGGVTYARNASVQARRPAQVWIRITMLQYKPEGQLKFAMRHDAVVVGVVDEEYRPAVKSWRRADGNQWHPEC